MNRNHQSADARGPTFPSPHLLLLHHSAPLLLCSSTHVVSFCPYLSAFWPFSFIHHTIFTLTDRPHSNLLRKLQNLYYIPSISGAAMRLCMGTLESIPSFFHLFVKHHSPGKMVFTLLYIIYVYDSLKKRSTASGATLVKVVFVCLKYAFVYWSPAK